MESLGARLKREREQRKMTLDEISTSTKIGTRFLIAIEDEQFDQLPGGIFNKGFIKAYARAVGVDEAEAVGYYELTTGASQPEIQPDNTLAVLAATPNSSLGFSGRGLGKWYLPPSLGMVCDWSFARRLRFCDMGLPHSRKPRPSRGNSHAVQ